MTTPKTSARESGERQSRARETLLLLVDAEAVARGTVVSAESDKAAALIEVGKARPTTLADLATWAREPVEI